MNNKLSDYIIEYPNAIPDEVCDSIIAKFEENQHYSYAGDTGTGHNVTDEDKAKISTDMFISNLPEFQEEDAVLARSLTAPLLDYHKMVREQCEFFKFVDDLIDKGFQVQRTDPGGKYDWHSDESITLIPDSIIKTVPRRNGRVDLNHACEYRMHTYIYYLNDASEFEGGRTQFRIGTGEDDIMSITPEKGKLILFPANCIFTHRGEPVTKGHKYLATGWVVKIMFQGSATNQLYNDSIRESHIQHVSQVNEAIIYDNNLPD